MEHFIIGLYPMDIQPMIGRFTLTNKRIRPRHIAARIDKFLISSSIMEDQVLILSGILPRT